MTNAAGGNEVIHECIVTTVDAAGQPNIAPMGVRRRGSRLVLMPFSPSATLSNLQATGCAVINRTTDVRVFAGALTGRRDWPLRAAEAVPGVRLATALAHQEGRVALVEGDPAQRAAFHLDVVHTANHAPFEGFNRAQAAVLEAAVLVSRLGMIDDAKIEREMAYLQIAIDKTAGPEEREAWGWLRAAIDAHRSGQAHR